MNYFAVLVKEHRKKRGLTQYDVAKCVGINRVTVHRIETGGWPTLENAVRLANLLGISLKRVQDKMAKTI